MSAGRFVIMLALAGLLSACATSTTAPPSSAAPTPSSGGITYREDKDLQKVWLADGFAFQGYQALYIQETRTDVPKVNPDGVENMKWASGFLRDEIVTALRAKGVFPVVAVNAAEVKPGMRVLRLENTIIEYEKGGGGARFFAGLYGAGQPVIRVRGRMLDGDRPVFVFEARRSGDTGTARMFGGYRGDKDIQQEDIRDLAVDLADFIVRNRTR
jgi:hypothetical protein